MVEIVWKNIFSPGMATFPTENHQISYLKTLLVTYRIQVDLFDTRPILKSKSIL